MVRVIKVDNPKSVFLLVGAKGSGKTYIGDLIEANRGISFIRVEQRLLEYVEASTSIASEIPNDGYDLELNWIDEVLSVRNEVISEATGSSKYLAKFLSNIALKYELMLIRVSCPLEVCFQRVRRRTQEHQFEVSDRSLREINIATQNVELNWALEIDNGSPADDRIILQAFDSLRARRFA